MEESNPDSDRSSMLFARYEGGDWIIVTHFAGEELPFGPSRLEELVVEVASLLVLNLRVNGTPAIVTHDPLPSARNARRVDLVSAMTAAQAQPSQPLRVEVSDAALLIPSEHSFLKQALSELPLASSMVYPCYPDLEPVLTIIEYAEGIGLRAMDDKLVMEAIHKTAFALKLVVEEGEIKGFRGRAILHDAIRTGQLLTRSLEHGVRNGAVQ